MNTTWKMLYLSLVLLGPAFCPAPMVAQVSLQVTSGVITLEGLYTTTPGGLSLSGNGFTSLTATGNLAPGNGCMNATPLVTQPIVPCGSTFLESPVLLNGVLTLDMDAFFNVTGEVPVTLSADTLTATIIEPVSYSGFLFACDGVCPALTNYDFVLDNDVGFETIGVTQVDGEFEVTSTSFSITGTTPEPSSLSLLLLGLGFLGLSLAKRKLIA